jgi:hypothetical protein
MRRLALILTALALVVPASVTAAEPIVDANDIELVFSDFYGNLEAGNPFFASGTDLAFEGEFVYAMEQADGGDSDGGVHIYNIKAWLSDPEENEPKVGFVDCPAWQNDVAVVEPGIIAVAYHQETGNACRTNAGTPGTQGVRLFDVSDPENPVGLGVSPNLPGGTHTLTVHPGGNHIYASPGGIANGGGTQQIVDITDRDPGGRFPVHTFLPNPTGCHDFAFFTSTDGRDMGVCVGLTQSQIWDTTDPTSPEIVSAIHNPLIDFMHTGIVTDDGKYLVISDEAIVANECLGGPTGAMFAYDIGELGVPEAPVPLGYFGIDRAYDDQTVNASTASSLHSALAPYGRTSWCTAHLYNFIPGTYIMVAAWYSGGVNIIDWSDMLNPREIAHFRLDGDYAEKEPTNYWSAYWHDGLIYANDRVRGLDVLEWTAYTDHFGDDAEPTAEEITAFAQSLPSTPASTWRAGRFFDTPTVEQAAWLAQRPAPTLSPYGCRLALTR